MSEGEQALPTAERTRPGWLRSASGKHRFVLAVSGLILLLDLLSKGWVQERFHLGESVPLWGEWLRLTYVLNPGAAFGIHVGPYSRQLFAALAVVAVVVIWTIVRQTPAADRLRLAALALILGGAVGNLLDRLRAHGGVVDFLDVGVGQYRWPVFNVADVGVTVGAMVLVALLWSDDAREAAPSAATSEADSRSP